MSLAEEASRGIICSKVVYSLILQTMGTRGFFLACGGNLGTNRARTPGYIVHFMPSQLSRASLRYHVKLFRDFFFERLMIEEKYE